MKSRDPPGARGDSGGAAHDVVREGDEPDCRCLSIGYDGERVNTSPGGGSESRLDRPSLRVTGPLTMSFDNGELAESA